VSARDGVRPAAPDVAPGAHGDARVDLASAILLCGAAGLVDAVGFMRHGAFAANMTGNTVLMAIALAERDLARGLECALTLAWFFAGVLLGRFAWRLARHRPAWPLALEAGILVVCAVVTAERALALGGMALAMGVQAAALTRFAGMSVSTVVVTSTMVRLAEANLDLLLRLFGRAASPDRAPLLIFAASWLAYAAGAALAVFLGFSTAVPIFAAAGLVIAVIALRTRRHR
jgi:uncharacterized membrane protein YoaK (UPF0700 family)